MLVELKRNPKGKYLKFEILGEPKSMQSVRSKVATKNREPIKVITKKGKTRFKIHQYQDKETENDKAYYKWSIAGQLPHGHELYRGAIVVHKLHYIFYPPDEYYKKVARGEYIRVVTNPDIVDNLNKMLFDCMQKLVFKNDNQVTDLDNLRKYYGLQPKILIELEELKK